MIPRAVLTSALLGSFLSPGISMSLDAQPPAARLLPRGDGATQRCTTHARIVAVRVIDRTTGEAVRGATITATRSRIGVRLEGARAMGTAGDYLVAEDGGVHGITRVGEPLVVEVRLGDRQARAEYVLGLTADGCHLELRDGPKTLRL